MYSQVFQDEFVFKLLGESGYFLDVGAGWAEPQLNSNSLYLEEKGWTGISIDGDVTSANNRRNRATNSLVLNLMIPDTNLIDIFKKYNTPKTIDYFSLDIEPISLIGLDNFPFNEYDFKVLTFEHDSYYTGIEQKQKSHKILNNLGYFCLCEDVKVPREFCENGYFEDWWVNPKYFSEKIIKNNTFKQKDGKYIVDNIKL